MGSFNVQIVNKSGLWFLINYCQILTKASALSYNVLDDGLVKFSKQVNSEAELRMYATVILPSLVQIMSCRLVGAKPLSEPILEYCWLDP